MSGIETVICVGFGPNIHDVRVLFEVVVPSHAVTGHGVSVDVTLGSRGAVSQCRKWCSCRLVFIVDFVTFIDLSPFLKNPVFPLILTHHLGP